MRPPRVLRLICLLATAWLLAGAGPSTAGDNPWLSRDLSRAELLPALRRGADYLARNLLPSGQFVYLQDPLGRCCRVKGDRYSLIRHLGAVYALIRAYETTQDPRYLEAANRGFAFARGFVVTSRTGTFVRGLAGAPNLGENGFLLVDGLKLDQLNHDQAHAPMNAGVARFLAANLKYDGPLATDEGWAESQAVIGLALFGARPGLDAAHAWLTAAMADDQPTHWSVQAAYWYHRARPGTDPELAAYGISSARTILNHVATGESGGPPRLVGAKAGRLYSCNAIARAEGLLAAHMMARDLKRGEDAGFFFTRAREHLAFTLQFQYGTDGNLYGDDPGMQRIATRFDLDGGVVNDPRTGVVRIDYVAHFVRAAAAYLEQPGVPMAVGLSLDDVAGS
jgi:hypothetical protein